MVTVALLAAWLWSWRGHTPGRRGETRVTRTRRPWDAATPVAGLSRQHATDMAYRLVAGFDPERMEPGYPLGVNLTDGRPICTSWEDMAVVFSGPRTGKSLCYAIPRGQQHAGRVPRPLPTTRATSSTRRGRCASNGSLTLPRICVFDHERIADPGAPRRRSYGT